MMSVRILLLFLVVASLCIAQEAETAKDELFAVIETQDKVVFEAGYNRCDIEALEAVVSDSLEYYHDEHGVTSSKDAFVAAIRDGICQLDYKPRRELVEGSMEVFPLKSSGSLYGAIQTGMHRFYAKYQGEDEKLTSIASFTILWLLEDGRWKMARVLSYDHRQP